MMTSAPADIFDAFLSHASENGEVASELRQSMQSRGLNIWVDAANIVFGGLLRAELQSAIGDSRTLVLLWSEAASRSRWVMAEMLTGFHLDRFIIPYVLDGTPLPQFLGNAAYLAQTRDQADITAKLSRAISSAPGGSNEPAPVLSYRSDEVEALVNGVGAAQIAVVQAMTQDFEKAEDANESIDDALDNLRALARFDLMVLNLSGYQCKNKYMFKHWEAIQAGRAPADPLLDQAERYFFDALCVDPREPSALNGLGSILMLERELDAAEFFQRRAIELASRADGNYVAAQHDLDLILDFKQKQREGRTGAQSGNPLHAQPDR